MWEEQSNDCCRWGGITCNSTTGHIVHLYLWQNCLYGTISLNSSLFKLLHLQELDLSRNHFNNSRISPLFGNLRNLTDLRLADSEFSGPIPNEIFQLPKLQYLDLSMNGRLTGNLASLNTTEIVELFLGDTGLSGEIPNFIGRFKSLKSLCLGNCHLRGTIPPSLSNLTNLVKLDLSHNFLSGQLPFYFWKLTKLSTLILSENKLSGPIDFEMFRTFNLIYLSLSNSSLSVTITNSSFSSVLPSIRILRLSSCGISENNLTFENSPSALWKLDLSKNNIGKEIHPSICNLQLHHLDLSDNQFTGIIPACLVKSPGLMVLYLQNNNFHGHIPHDIGFAPLEFLDLSNNGLEGALPRSLTNCTYLEVLNLGGNKLMDGFPFWLGDLPSLKVLVLRENKFQGPINEQFNSFFSNLHIIDLSHNNFSGSLPSKYFENWNAMSIVDENSSKLGYIKLDYEDFYSVTIIDKGVSLFFEKILETMNVIDFSHNKFNGDIPISVGRLKSIQVLNLSGNSLTGSIPLSLGNLENLESLDLSSNNLYGEIPQEMSNLKFIEFFNISENNLSGAIPPGGQLTTFSNASYEENPNLCGFLLSKLCRITSSPNLSLDKSHRNKFKIDGFCWEIVLIGYTCGIMFGVMLGLYFLQDKDELIGQIFRLKIHSQAKRSNNRRNRGSQDF